VRQLEIGDLIYIKQYKCSYLICRLNHQYMSVNQVALVRLGKLKSSDHSAFVCGQGADLFNSITFLQKELEKGNIVYLGNLGDTVEKAVKKAMK